MSDTRETQQSSEVDIPPRPDVAAGSDPEASEESRPEEQAGESGPPEATGPAVIRPFEPVSAPNFEDVSAEPAPSQTSEQTREEEPVPEPKRRWRRRRKEPKMQPAAEVPLEQGHAEPVPGPGGLFEHETRAASATSEDSAPAPAASESPAAMGRPDAEPITPYEPDAHPQQVEHPGSVVRPSPGHYRLPDDFAFGPGGKPQKAKRGS